MILSSRSFLAIFLAFVQFAAFSPFVCYDLCASEPILPASSNSRQSLIPLSMSDRYQRVPFNVTWNAAQLKDWCKRVFTLESSEELEADLEREKQRWPTGLDVLNQVGAGGQIFLAITKERVWGARTRMLCILLR